MKRKILFVFLFLTASFCSVYAQSKKELESQKVQLTRERDSIQALLTKVSGQFDSIHKIYLEYDKMYKALRDKEVNYAFKPENTGKILDSIHLNRDSVISKIKIRVALVRDSVKKLNRIIDSLNLENKSLNFVVNKYIGKGTIPATSKDFTGVWKFNTRWFEFAVDSIQSGVILSRTPAELNPIEKIVFLDHETALLIFSKGDSTRCFFKINSFANDMPFSMDISRENKVNIRILMNPVDGELYVCYRKPKGYLYGFIRKQ
jgi:hypothetical protein